MSCTILGLDSKFALQEERAGGKGASLARLRKHGFNVPPGFVITPAAFQDFLASLGIQTLAQKKDWVQTDVERIRELLLACRIPDRLSRPIRKAYRRLRRGSGDPLGAVAVRSSMVGEDARTSSFAGQLDTILNVRGERELLEAIVRCWASMFNWRTFKYMAERETLPLNTVLERLSIAVVVQRMVDARAAGVAFSADPITGQRCVVIEAVPGLGDALVQGLAEPDRYVVDARGVLAQVQPANPDAPVLEEGQILHLVQIIRGVARRAKDPQDVEWGWDGTEFHLLQSRPITSLAGQRVYSNRMVSDMSPGLIKPLVYTTNTLAMTRNVFQRIFTELIGPNDIDFAPLATRIHSRIYTDMTLLGQLLERLGLPANLFEMVARDESPDRRRPPLTWKMLRTTFRLCRFAWRQARIADEIATFAEQHDQEIMTYRHADWSSTDPQELMAQLDRLVCLHSGSQWFIFICAMNMLVRNRLLARWVTRWVPDLTPGDLVRGLVGLKALEPNEELQRLAAQARTLGDEVQRLLIIQDDRTIRAALSTSDEGRALVRSMDAFMGRYGFLSTNGTDFAETPWIENPTLIWHAIGWAARAGGDRFESHEPRSDDFPLGGRRPVPVARVPPLRSIVYHSPAAIREAAQKHARAHLNWMQRTLFDRLLSSTITYINLRERISMLMSEDSYQMRRLFLTLADRLVARGYLNQRDDIFYLTHDQIRPLMEGTQQADVVRSLVRARRAEMQADAEIDPPDTICGEYVPTCPVSLVEGQEYLVGIGSGSGIAQGRARIILDPAEAPATLTGDDILVVPFTDVGWTPLFPGIGGIVAETGGQLSHTSIVAREYGLPAVVNVKKATRLIKDGQLVTVDGDRGRVYLSAQPADRPSQLTHPVDRR